MDGLPTYKSYFLKILNSATQIMDISFSKLSPFRIHIMEVFNYLEDYNPI
ncbi:MAG: hypothetical protein METHAR1v1_1520004 [Methanothrix sp.]|nr:MAG: hypothetical protein METHAR1v1_1520004 [Methanothrix sp.]